jgi:hypothetical protein
MAETTQKSTSQVDPAILPFLTTGLERAQSLFLTGDQPSFFPGQTYVSPSAQTTEALAQQEALARQASPVLQQAQQAFTGSLTGLGQTAGGGFLQGNPYQEAMMQAATRPLQQQFSNQVLPGISSLYSKTGRLGSGAMAQALGQASEGYGRALGDVTSQIAGQTYAQERQNQLNAQAQMAQLAQAAPSIYGQQFIPSQQLAQVGQAQEAIAAQPLQEAMARYQFQQQLPYEQLSGYLSSVYGSPLGRYGTQSTTGTMPSNTGINRLAGAGVGYLGGQALGSVFGGSPFSLSSPTGFGLGGAALGGLLGGSLFG